MRNNPNILVTGTPGTGKTLISTQCSEDCNLTYISINDIAKQNNFYSGYDNERSCHIIDEDAVMDELEDQMNSGGCIVDYHACDFFPERWFDLVVVLRTEISVLHRRLVDKGYSPSKVDENVQCEIFQVLLDEAREAYKPDVVHEAPNTDTDDMQHNIDRIADFVRQFREASAANSATKVPASSLDCDGDSEMVDS